MGDEIIGIPKPLNQNKYNVELHVGNKKYTTFFDYFEEKLVDGCWVVKFSDFKQIPKPIKNVIMPNRVIAFLEGAVLCALLIGGSMIINKHFCNGNMSQGSLVDTASVLKHDSVVSNVTTDDEIQRLLSDYDTNLKKKDLSFEEVDKIYDEYSKDINRCKNINSDICKRIEDYKNVADYIRNKEYDKIVAYIKKPGKKINKDHLNLVKLITNGVVSGLSDFEAYNYDSSRIKQVKEYFKNNDFQSFLGLLNIATYLKENSQSFQKNESKKNESKKNEGKKNESEKKYNELG